MDFDSRAADSLKDASSASTEYRRKARRMAWNCMETSAIRADCCETRAIPATSSFTVDNCRPEKAESAKANATIAPKPQYRRLLIVRPRKGIGAPSLTLEI